jgi:hypothetical protein
MDEQNVIIFYSIYSLKLCFFVLKVNILETHQSESKKK